MSWWPCALDRARFGYACLVLRAFLLSLILLLGAAPAAQAVEVRWAIADGPPYHMESSRNARRARDLGDGMLDLLIAGVAQHAPEMRHQFVVMSRPRMWRAMQAGEPLCYADAFRTAERLRFAHFTPATPPLPMVLVVRKGQLGDVGEVSLATVLARKDLRGVFESERSYGVTLDALIANAGPHVGILPLPDTPQLLRMLEAGRMDYLVEYPTAVQYLHEQLKPRPALDFLALREEREPQPSFIACTRSAWGQEVVQALDGALRRWAATPDAAQSVLRWLPPDIAQREAGRVESFYRERARVSQVD